MCKQFLERRWGVIFVWGGGPLFTQWTAAEADDKRYGGPRNFRLISNSWKYYRIFLYIYIFLLVFWRGSLIVDEMCVYIHNKHLGCCPSIYKQRETGAVECFQLDEFHGRPINNNLSDMEASVYISVDRFILSAFDHQKISFSSPGQPLVYYFPSLSIKIVVWFPQREKDEHGRVSFDSFLDLMACHVHELILSHMALLLIQCSAQLLCALSQPLNWVLTAPEQRPDEFFFFNVFFFVLKVEWLVRTCINITFMVVKTSFVLFGFVDSTELQNGCQESNLKRKEIYNAKQKSCLFVSHVRKFPHLIQTSFHLNRTRPAARDGRDGGKWIVAVRKKSSFILDMLFSPFLFIRRTLSPLLRER